MKKLSLILLFVSLSASVCLFAQSQDNQNDIFETIYKKNKALAETQQYRLIAETVYKDKSRKQLNPDSNIISINKSEISGVLNTLKSQNKTFQLIGAIEAYSVAFDDDKQEVSIQFSIKSMLQPSEIAIVVKPNGKAFLELKSAGVSTSYICRLERL
jgi:hypothetical protein